MNYRKEIAYDYETRDYALYLDGELVGFARTYHEGEVTLDQLVFELLSGDAVHTATELDSGSDPDAMAAESTAGLIDPLPDPGPGGPGVPGDERPKCLVCYDDGFIRGDVSDQPCPYCAAADQQRIYPGPNFPKKVFVA